MTVARDTTAEFSRNLRLDRLAGGRVERQLEATEAEREALARRFGLLGLESLTGTVQISRPMDSPLVRIEGGFAADVRQTCVVTLMPFAAHVEEDFVQLFTLDEVPDPGGEVFVAVDEEDTPEPIQGDAIDLGEVLAEQLALALDPHPRAPGAEFEKARYGVGDDEAPSDEDEDGKNPFAALKHLKRDR